MKAETMQPVAARRWGATYPGGQWLYFTGDQDGEKLCLYKDLLSLTSTLESLQRENEELRAALVAAKTRMRNCRGAIESDQVIDKDVHGSLQNGIRDIEAALASTGGEHHAE